MLLSRKLRIAFGLHIEEQMSIIQKLGQGYLSANYPGPNNAFTRFTEHSEKAV